MTLHPGLISEDIVSRQLIQRLNRAEQAIA